MEKITSRQNKIIKLVHKLANSSKERKKQNLTMFDGISFIKDYLQSGRECQYIIVNQRIFEQEAKFLQDFDKVILVSDDLIDYISPVKTSSGMVLIINIPNQLAEINPEKTMIILEQIQDAGNLGAIMRSCLAFGVKQIILSEKSVDPFSPETIRASAGACFDLKIYKNVDLRQFISENDLDFIATTPHTDIELRDLQAQIPVFVFGNEGRGLSPEIMNLIDNKIKIKQSNKIESLNLSNSVAICLYQMMKL